MRAARWSLWVWYRGDRFRGYQTQPEGPTVQQELHAALARAGVPGRFAAAGRTDKGVHARMQALSGRVRAALPLEALEAAIRSELPEGLGLCAARPAARAFHAQWSAAGKEYRYRLALGAPPAKWAPFAWAPEGEVDLPLLARTLASAQGSHDFIAFHAKSSVRKVRTLERAEVRELSPGLVEARLSADSFGRYQVRYLVGSAVAVAMGRLSAAAFDAAVQRGEPIAGVRAPARGLVLWEVRYAPEVDPFPASLRGAPPHLPAAPPFDAP